MLISKSVDILQPNVCYVGGYTEGAKVAALAQAFNVPVANGGGWPHHNAHLIAAVSNGLSVEFHYLMWMVGNVVYRQPPQPEKGWVKLGDQPGLGLEPNWDALRQYQEHPDAGVASGQEWDFIRAGHGCPCRLRVRPADNAPAACN